MPPFRVLNLCFLFISYLLYICRHPRWCSGKEPACQCRRCRGQGFDPWVGKMPWRRKWQPTPVFSLHEKSHGQRSLEGYSPWVANSQTRLEQARTSTNASMGLGLGITLHKWGLELSPIQMQVCEDDFTQTGITFPWEGHQSLPGDCSDEVAAHSPWNNRSLIHMGFCSRLPSPPRKAKGEMVVGGVNRSRWVSKSYFIYSESKTMN